MNPTEIKQNVTPGGNTPVPKINAPESRDASIQDAIDAATAVAAPIAKANNLAYTPPADLGNVNAQDLVDSKPAPNIPEPQTPQTPQAFVDSLQSVIEPGIITADTPEAKRRSAILDRINALSDNTPSEQDTYTNALNSQIEQITGIPADLFEQSLADANKKLALLQGKYRTQAEKISGASGQSQVAENYGLAENDREKAVEVGNQAILVQALQGNLQTAQQIALQTANFAADDQKTKLNNLMAQYNALDGIVTGQTQQLVDQKKAEAKYQLDQIDNMQTAVNTAISSGGATVAEMQQLTSTKVSNEDKLALAQQITARVAQQNLSLDQAVKNENIKNLQSEIDARNNPNGTQTAAQAKAEGFAKRTDASDKIITKLGNKMAVVSQLGANYLPNILQSADQQMYQQAERDFVNAVLRQESGAAISPSEFDSAEKQYFPQPGDSVAVIQQKAANRQTTINNLYTDANATRTASAGQVIEGADGTQYLVGSDGETITPL